MYKLKKGNIVAGFVSTVKVLECNTKIQESGIFVVVIHRSLERNVSKNSP